jgi:hypothetical protein
LERRADIFFAVYLKRILEAELDIDVVNIIPEFPLKKESSNQSVKADYACFTSTKKVVLVELKTDNDSLTQEQLDDYRRALAAGWEKVIDGVNAIQEISTERKKYKALGSSLKETSSVSVSRAGKTKQWAARGGWSFYGKIAVIKPSMEKRDKKKFNADGKVVFIPFRKVAKYLEADRSELASRFVESLDDWSRKKTKRRK